MKAFQAVGLFSLLIGMIGLGIGLAWSQPAPVEKKVVGSPGVEQFALPPIQQAAPPDKHTLYLCQTPNLNFWHYRTDIYDSHPYDATVFADFGARTVIVPYNGSLLKDVPQADINAFIKLAFPVPPPPFGSPYEPNRYAQSLGL